MNRLLNTSLGTRITDLHPAVLEVIINKLRAQFRSKYDKPLFAYELAQLARTCRDLRAVAAPALLDDFAALFVHENGLATLGLGYIDKSNSKLVYLGPFDARSESEDPRQGFFGSVSSVSGANRVPAPTNWTVVTTHSSMAAEMALMVVPTAWVTRIGVYNADYPRRLNDYPPMTRPVWQPLHRILAQLPDVEHVLIESMCSHRVAEGILMSPGVANRLKSVTIKTPETTLSLLGGMVFPRLTTFRLWFPNASVAINALPAMPNSAKVRIDSADHGAELSMGVLLALTAYEDIEITGPIRIVATGERLSGNTDTLLMKPEHGRLWRATLSPSALRQFHDLLKIVGDAPMRSLTDLTVDVRRSDAAFILGTELTELSVHLVSLSITGTTNLDEISLLPAHMELLARLSHLEYLDAPMYFSPNDNCERYPLAAQSVFPVLQRIRTSVHFFTHFRRCTFPALRSVVVVLDYSLWPLIDSVPVPNVPSLTSWTVTGIDDETTKGNKFVEHLVPMNEIVRPRAPMLVNVQLRVPTSNAWLLQRAPKLA